MTEEKTLETSVYYVVKKDTYTNVARMELVYSCEDINEARFYCCKKLGFLYKPRQFDEEYKMKFWKHNVTFYII